MKTSGLTGTALDWAVAMVEGLKPEDIFIAWHGLCRRMRDDDGELTNRYMTGPDLLYSRKWEAGGPIIEEHCITIDHDRRHDSKQPWQAAMSIDPYNKSEGTTPLIAAMRCYVASKLGNEVDVPKELV